MIQFYTDNKGKLSEICSSRDKYEMTVRIQPYVYGQAEQSVIMRVADEANNSGDKSNAANKLLPDTDERKDNGHQDNTHDSELQCSEENMHQWTVVGTSLLFSTMQLGT